MSFHTSDATENSLSYNHKFKSWHHHSYLWSGALNSLITEKPTNCWRLGEVSDLLQESFMNTHHHLKYRILWSWLFCAVRTFCPHLACTHLILALNINLYICYSIKMLWQVSGNRFNSFHNHSLLLIIYSCQCPSEILVKELYIETNTFALNVVHAVILNITVHLQWPIIRVWQPYFEH